MALDAHYGAFAADLRDCRIRGGLGVRIYAEFYELAGAVTGHRRFDR